MTTEQLYAGGAQILPEGNYEKDNAAERIRNAEEKIEGLQSKTYTAADVGADPIGSADEALQEAIAHTNEKISELGVKGEAETEYRIGKVNITKQNLGIPNVENKSSATIRNEITKANVTSALGYTPETDGAYENATAYTDTKISDLINGAPTTMDTLKEIADAMEENQTVVEALETAIGNKASDVEFQAHKDNTTVHITVTERTNWNAAKTHADSAHAPSDAQKNSDITKAEIEAKLTGTITSHTHDIDIPDVQIMTPTTNGIGKPDDITIGVSNGTFSTKFKNYTSLADIGLTAPATCLEIATAMADGSEIVLNDTEVSELPVSPCGVIIRRPSSWYVHAMAYERTSGGRIWTKYIRISGGSGNVDGVWSTMLNRSMLTANLLATTTGNALDATMGKVLDDKINSIPVVEIADDLVTDDSEKALSAAQGKVLKGLVDSGGSSGILFHELNLPSSAIRFVTFNTTDKVCTDATSISPINANSSSSFNIVIDETVTGGETLALLHIGMNHAKIWVSVVFTSFTKADGYTYKSMPVNVYTCVFFNRGDTSVQLSQGDSNLRGTILIKDN